jgi:alkylation response protein AidB-like acyl-CoA dehydrogenase
MDFKFNEEQTMLRDAFAEFVKTDVAPNAAEWDREDHCPVELFPKMGELGILGIYVPEQYGGVGLGHVERLIAIEEIARYSPGLSMAVFTHQLLVTGILDYGTEEQKQKYLPGLCAGTIIGTMGVTEPGGGSDFAGQKSTADFADGQWTISGRKCFITNSHIADVIGVTAKTGTDEKGRALFSVFII